MRTGLARAREVRLVAVLRVGEMAGAGADGAGPLRIRKRRHDAGAERRRSRLREVRRPRRSAPACASGAGWRRSAAPSGGIDRSSTAYSCRDCAATRARLPHRGTRGSLRPAAAPRRSSRRRSPRRPPDAAPPRPGRAVRPRARAARPAAPASTCRHRREQQIQPLVRFERAGVENDRRIRRDLQRPPHVGAGAFASAHRRSPARSRSTPTARRRRCRAPPPRVAGRSRSPPASGGSRTAPGRRTPPSRSRERL